MQMARVVLFALLLGISQAADDTYKCSVCQHVYDPVKDGGGKPFSELPDTFKCPVCGSPKSAFKKQASAVDQSAVVVTDDTYKCSVCQHVYDPVKDGGGKAFADLPDTFKCPVCGSPKSAFKKQASAVESVDQWAVVVNVTDDTYKCSVCQHVYDPVKDGGGKAFADLPDTFKCPVCGSPKSAFKKQASAAERVVQPTVDTYKFACAHSRFPGLCCAQFETKSNCLNETQDCQWKPRKGVGPERCCLPGKCDDVGTHVLKGEHTVEQVDTYKCTVCAHVYDPVKDGGGKAFADLPDTWKCPVCGSPKSAYKKQAMEESEILVVV